MRLQHFVLYYPLVNLLQQVASLVFWWPSISIDRTLAVHYVHGTVKASYHPNILLLTKSFLNLIPYIGKPNVHHLLELAVHTIHIHVHSLFVSELVFESCHQTLKFHCQVQRTRMDTSTRHSQILPGTGRYVSHTPFTLLRMFQPIRT